MTRTLALGIAFSACLTAQEAKRGLDLSTTLSGSLYHAHELQDGPVGGGFRGMLYPTWKFNERWSASAAVQVVASPYFREQFSEPREGKINVLQAQLTYARVGKDKALAVRIGQLPSAFGAFLLRYDDAANPLPDMPIGYGYYYRSVTTLGLPGVQIDANLGKLDVRGQFTNSSPANRRTLLDSDQYGSYTAGAGYTIRQGFRVGTSFLRGPYLHRQHAFFFPGEARPKELPATGIGFDVQYGRGPWNAYGEWQYHQRNYKAIPNFLYRTGYAELRRVLTPRWYLATRLDYERASAYPGRQILDLAVGYRPNRHQLVKVGYGIASGPAIRGSLSNVLSVQLITAFRALSIAHN